MNRKVISKRSVTDQHKRAFSRVLQRYGRKKIVVLPHNFTDWDGAASAAALAQFMGWTFSLNHPTEHSILRGLEKLEFQHIPHPQLDPEKFDGMVIVDTNSVNMLPASFPEWEGKICLVIDHHKRSDGLGAEEEIIISGSVATAEILAELLLSKSRDRVTKEMSMALAAGIYADTMKFGVSRDHETFRMFPKLLEIAEVEAHDIKNLAFPTASGEEAKLVMDAFNKMQYTEYGGIIIIATAACDRVVQRRVVEMMSELFPISIAASNCVQMRHLTIRIDDEFDLDGSKVMKTLGEMHGGTGGGHEKSAGCGGHGSVYQMLADAVRLVKDALDVLSSR